MAQSRAFIPSRTFLKALPRPITPSCFLSRSGLAQLSRGKRTKATEIPSSRKKIRSQQEFLPRDQAGFLKEFGTRMESALAKDDILRPMTDRELEAADLPVINWYQEDMGKGSPRRLVKTIATPEDRRREQNLGMMIEESYKNPNYDDTELNRRLIDDMIADPDFAEVKDSLEEIKGDLIGEKERNALEDQAEKYLNAQAEELGANMRAAAYQGLQDLIDDPDLVEAREQLLDAQAKLPEHTNPEDPEFQAALENSMALLKDNDAFQKKMAAMAEEPANVAHEKRIAQIEKGLDEVIAASEDEEDDLDLDMEPSEDLQASLQLLLKLRGIFKSIGDKSGIIAEIDSILKEDPQAIDGFDFESETDPEELVESLKELIQSKSIRDVTDIAATDAIELPYELRAKIGQLVADPEFPERLMEIQKLISQQQQADITMIPHETALEPHELDQSRTTTLKQQLLVARNSPEHIAAIQRLRVTLISPYNISPALGSFNQAIELAYIGANDDVRRTLWRAYQKARVIPTFLQNVTDEAWDILYYSQAVKWPSNQNRHSHLKAILADLKSLGRDGPPTHPSSLVEE